VIDELEKGTLVFHKQDFFGSFAAVGFLTLLNGGQLLNLPKK
jgi:hypothetical protein